MPLLRGSHKQSGGAVGATGSNRQTSTPSGAGQIVVHHAAATVRNTVMEFIVVAPCWIGPPPGRA
jgi:hypothetical protein